VNPVCFFDLTIELKKQQFMQAGLSGMNDLNQLYGIIKKKS